MQAVSAPGPSESNRQREEEVVFPPALSLTGVTVRFGAVTALADVTFRVPKGSITGLIGRNGAGKSTSIRLLAGLLSPGKGEVAVLGKSFTEAEGVMGGKAAQIKKNTGYLLSEPALFAYLTPVETLRFLAESYGLSAAEGARRAEDLIAFFELTGARERVVEGFSTGMQKRLALAAALVHSPQLLVLDEPFESLDPLIVRKIKQLLVQYVHEGGSVLLSSHLIDAVDEICDRVVILDRGRIVVDDTTAEAKRRVEGQLGPATLEELYAAVVEGRMDTTLEWLSQRERL
ncbi:MAG: ABC transporter ATP-binding protein [Gemmatimonadetes bacterium]|nr:ABC transporter ATP-binding protein [Gemmatimonadota bacterium]